MLRIIHQTKYSNFNQVVINLLEQIPDLFGPCYPKILMSLEVSIYFPTVPVASSSLSISEKIFVGQIVLEPIGEVCWTTLRFRAAVSNSKATYNALHKESLHPKKHKLPFRKDMICQCCFTLNRSRVPFISSLETKQVNRHTIFDKNISYGLYRTMFILNVL